MESDHSRINSVERVGTGGRRQGGINMTAPERILELLPRNLQEVVGAGDAARRRAAIEDFYTDDCVLHVPEPDGTFVGRSGR
jgi:hypothetical protein